MRFHRISPCPKCGGKVKAKWERDGVQTLVNVATAFSITDEELAQAMDDCLVHNQERGRL